ncbi:hypothetical protein D918_09090 [Trichuris suis]|nr:hypothetical protein D918_09090 [Trichuris suis]
MQRFEFCYAFVFPVALLIAALLRPCLLSLLYGIFLLLWPVFATGCKQGTSGEFTPFLVAFRALTGFASFLISSKV